jgi:PAS domain S-box-containing protein
VAGDTSVQVLYVGDDRPSATDGDGIVFDVVERTAATERLATDEYDCLVVDAPDESLLETIRGRWPTLPQVIYGAIDDGDDVDRMYDVADGFVRRGGPGDDRMLVRRVRTLVRRYEERWASEHLRSIAKNTSDGILTIDDDSVIRFANPAAAEMFGYDADDLIGTSLTVLMDDSLAERHLAGLERYFETGERTIDWDGVELTGQRRDGTELPVHVSFNEFVHNGQRFFTGIVRNITDRRKRERERRRYETIVETMGDGVYVLDDEGRFVTVNDRYAEMIGYSREELVGRCVETIVREETTAQAEAIQASFEDADDVATLETTLQTADGRELPIEARLSPYPLGDGSYGRVGVVRDLRERKHLESELSGILNRVTDAFFALDEEWRFTYVNERAEELLDRTEAELLDKVVWDEFPEAVGMTFQEEYERAMESQTPVAFEEYFPPLECWFAVSAYPSKTGLSVYFRDVTDRRRREETIRALSDGARALMDAETREAVGEIGVGTARDVVGLPNPVIALYDEDSGRLRPTDESEETAERIGPPLFAPSGDDLAWETFVDGERRVYDSLSTVEADESRSAATTEGAKSVRDASPPSDAVESALVYPLGRHGVLATASDEPEAFDDLDVSLANTLAANVQTALDRADREETIRERSRELEERNQALERLRRINEVIREITQVLTTAGTREEIETAICERLVEITPYRFAWIGARDTRGTEVVPLTTAGDAFEEDLELSIEEAPEAPTMQALRDRETAVAKDIRTDAPFDPWRAGALRKGYRSIAAVPLLHRESLYGVLTIYADDATAFEPTERTVLTELGEMIGYALNALERKRALVGDRSVELDFRVRGPDDPLLTIVVDTDCELEFEHVVQRSDGSLHVFFSALGVDADRVADRAEDLPGIDESRLVSDREEKALFECTLSDAGFLSALLDRGGLPQSLAAQDGKGRLVVRTPQAGDVRSFIELFEQHYREVELVARREHDEPVRTDEEFRGEFKHVLTDRQEEVLRTAYYAGFFDWPRRHTGQEVADMLGVSQPTVNRHMREGERKLFSLLFEE